MQQTAHKVVVIGHRNPDTDSICSAIAYAELKNKTSDLVCEARRAGKMNQETEFVLKKFGVTPPRMCTDVNPKIRDVDYRQIPGIPGSTSLRKAWEIMRDQKIDTLPRTMIFMVYKKSRINIILSFNPDSSQFSIYNTISTISYLCPEFRLVSELLACDLQKYIVERREFRNNPAK